MDKVFSTRLDEATLDELSRLTRPLRVTKRRSLEEAIRLRAQQSGAAADVDVWAETLGAWQRREGAPATIRRGRQQFRQSFQRLKHYPMPDIAVTKGWSRRSGIPRASRLGE